MFLARLQKRVTSATPVGIGCLAGYRLLFNKRSDDGSSKCNILSTGNTLDSVMGVVFEFNEDEMVNLNCAEKGYEQKMVPISTEAGAVPALAYVASKDTVESLLPYSWYRDYVLAGARQHGLPASYIASVIEPVGSTSDPNAARAVRHQRVMGKYADA